MIQRVDQPFRFVSGLSYFQNWQDNGFISSGASAAGCQYTQGATQLDQANLQLPVRSLDRAQILAFSVVGQLSLATTIGFAAITGTISGKLGRIIAGVGIRLQPTGGIPTGPWTSPMLPLPADADLFGDLWNPANNPLPPIWLENSNGPQATLQVSLSLTLPQPLPLIQGQPVVGMWATPSLIPGQSNGSLVVRPTMVRAAWSMIYDDGR